MMTPEDFTVEASRLESEYSKDNEALNQYILELYEKVLTQQGFSAGVAILERARLEHPW